MALTARPRIEVGDCLQQRREPFPVTAKPGEKHQAHQQETRDRGQRRFWPPKHRERFLRADSRARRLEQRLPVQKVKNGGLLACEHQRSAGCGQDGLPAERHFACAPAGQNQSKRGGGKKGLMNEISVVVDRQRSAGKQQRGDQAGHESRTFRPPRQKAES